MIKAVLFDLDGTLTNTLEDIATAMNRALAMHGLPGWETQEYCYLVGNGARILAQRAVREHQELLDAVQKEYQAYYEKHSLVKTRPYDGVVDLLHALSERGLKLAVLSNKPDADTKTVIAHFFPDIAWSCVRGQVEGVPVKPNPSGAWAAAEQLGVKPEEVLYLGDTKVDMACACSAGMHPVGVLWGFRTEQELRENGAEYVISHPMELLNVCKM